MTRLSLFLPFALMACDTDPVLALDGDADAGAQTWAAECGLCHGQNAEGTSRGSGLVGIFERRTDEEILDVVRFGVATMPAYEERLSDQDLADLLAWMQQEL